MITTFQGNNPVIPGKSFLQAISLAKIVEGYLVARHSHLEVGIDHKSETHPNPFKSTMTKP
jgi:hypothetical protein